MGTAVKLERAGTADIEFELSWRSPEAAHVERYLAPRASLWRDCFRPELESRLLGAAAGDEVVAEYAAGEAVPPWSERALVELRAESVRDGVGPERVPLRLGRFYPAGLLSGVTTLFAQDLRPARVVEAGEAGVVLDLNHPLARFPLRLRARVLKISPPGGKRSSACHDWLEEASGGGPGLQARCGGRQTDFSEPDALVREDASDDVLFYAAPRLVGHVDACAAAILREEHARRIPAGARVLDLMSSAVSHLAGDRGLEIDGLGLNREELDANPLLHGRIVHDLNKTPAIPADDRSYGAVVCSLSWEYLTSPDRVLREAARVLAPGGLLLIGLSNRWFPPKVTRLWERLHEFERVGLVLGQVLDSGGFRHLETLSARNWPRPEEDRHGARLCTADPIHLVAAAREE